MKMWKKWSMSAALVLVAIATTSAWAFEPIEDKVFYPPVNETAAPTWLNATATRGDNLSAVCGRYLEQSGNTGTYTTGQCITTVVRENQSVSGGDLFPGPFTDDNPRALWVKEGTVYRVPVHIAAGELSAWTKGENPPDVRPVPPAGISLKAMMAFEKLAAEQTEELRGEVSADLGELRKQLARAADFDDLASLYERVSELEATAAKAKAWDVPELARQADAMSASLNRRLDGLEKAMGEQGSRLSAVEDKFGNLSQTYATNEELANVTKGLAADVDKKIDTATKGLVTGKELTNLTKGFVTDGDLSALKIYIIVGGLVILALIGGWLLMLGSRQRQIEQDLASHGNSLYGDNGVEKRLDHLEKEFKGETETLTEAIRGAAKQADLAVELAKEANETAEEAMDIAISVILTVNEGRFEGKLPTQEELEEKLDKDGKILEVKIDGKIVTFTRDDHALDKGVRTGLVVRGLGPELDKLPIAFRVSNVGRVIGKAILSETIVGTDNSSGNGDNGNGDNGQGDQKAA